jgi:hypothetical protein
MWLTPEVGKLLLGNFNLLPAILETMVLAQFGGQKLEFPLGATRKLVVGGEALLPVDEAARAVYASFGSVTS